MKIIQNNVEKKFWNQHEYYEFKPAKRKIMFWSYRDDRGYLTSHGHLHKKEFIELNFPYVQFWPKFQRSTRWLGHLWVTASNEELNGNNATTLPLPHVNLAVGNVCLVPGMWSKYNCNSNDEKESLGMIKHFWESAFRGDHFTDLVIPDFQRWQSTGELPISRFFSFGNMQTSLSIFGPSPLHNHLAR